MPVVAPRIGASAACPAHDGKARCSLIESPRVPRIGKVEFLIVERVAEFVTERAQERSEGCDLVSHRRSHPHPDHHGLGSVVSEKFHGPLFPHIQRPGGKHTDAAIWDLVEVRCSFEKIRAGAADLRDLRSRHCRVDRACNYGQRAVIRHYEGRDPLTPSQSLLTYDANLPWCWSCSRDPEIRAELAKLFG